MANYPQELAQAAVCQSHTGHMTLLWFLPARPLRLNTNEWMNIPIYVYLPHRLLTCILTFLLIYLLTYSLTPGSRVLLEKVTGSQLVKKFPAFYGTRRFITAFTLARQLPLSWASSTQSMPPHITSLRSVLILSSRLRLGLPSGLFPSGFLKKTLHTSLLSPTWATCPAHLILLDLITRIILGEDYSSSSSSLCIFLHSTIPRPS